MPLLTGTTSLDLAKGSVGIFRIRLLEHSEAQLGSLYIRAAGSDEDIVVPWFEGYDRSTVRRAPEGSTEILASVQLPAGRHEIVSINFGEMSLDDDPRRRRWEGRSPIRAAFSLRESEVAYLGRIDIAVSAGDPGWLRATVPAVFVTKFRDDYREGLDVFRDHHPLLLRHEVRNAPFESLELGE